jgi:hypothetical protein
MAGTDSNNSLPNRAWAGRPTPGLTGSIPLQPLSWIPDRLDRKTLQAMLPSSGDTSTILSTRDLSVELARESDRMAWVAGQLVASE